MSALFVRINKAKEGSGRKCQVVRVGGWGWGWGGYLPHSCGVSFPAPHPPSPSQPSWSQYRSAPSQSAPLGYDKTSPDIKPRTRESQQSKDNFNFKNPNFGHFDVKVIFSGESNESIFVELLINLLRDLMEELTEGDLISVMEVLVGDKYFPFLAPKR